jgi:glycosyltransferase involved in cell wall biosynthesis
MSKPRLVVIGPVPPPFHGVAVSTSLVLANPVLRERFAMAHLDTSDRRSLENIGRWDVGNVVLGLLALARLNRLLRGDPGVVYLPLSAGAGGVMRDSLFIHLASLRGWSVATHLRAGEEFQDFYRAQPRPIRWWVRRTLGRVDSMGVMGQSLRSVFDGLVPRERVAVISNGTPDIASGDTEPRNGTVLFLSNLRARKGLVESVQAAHLVRNRHPDAQFLFVGAWDDDDLEHRVRTLAGPAGDRIRFLPAVSGDGKRDLLLSASILLFPPVESEGHPRVVLEAMAAGIPLVTTDRGAIAETVVHGESAFVLDHPDPERLAECVLRLLEDDDLRREMGRAARRRYLSEFTQEKADERLAAWLDKLTPAAKVSRSPNRSGEDAESDT